MIKRLLINISLIELYYLSQLNPHMVRNNVNLLANQFGAPTIFLSNKIFFMQYYCITHSSSSMLCSENGHSDLSIGLISMFSSLRRNNIDEIKIRVLLSFLLLLSNTILLMC